MHCAAHFQLNIDAFIDGGIFTIMLINNNEWSQWNVGNFSMPIKHGKRSLVYVLRSFKRFCYIGCPLTCFGELLSIKKKTKQTKTKKKQIQTINKAKQKQNKTRQKQKQTNKKLFMESWYQIRWIPPYFSHRYVEIYGNLQLKYVSFFQNIGLL